MKILILGAGLTGVELGRRLKELNKDFLILEKEAEIGGLCRTNISGRYRWDFGVHAIYSSDQSVIDYFHSLPLDYAHLNRNVKIFHTGSDNKTYILDYPFEMGIKNLPLKDKWECIKGYFAANRRRNKKYTNLEEWINEYLGEGIARHFMIPYNKKIWNCPLKEISEKIVSSKIEPASLYDIILSVLGRKIIGRKCQAKFLYPKQGIQILVDHVAKDIKNRIILSADVKELKPTNNKWSIILESGENWQADIVISTIPLPELLKKIKVNGIEKEYPVFRWNNTYFVMMGLKEGYNFNLNIRDCHWAFFKEKEIFYRVTLPHVFDKDFLPTLVAEITQKDGLSQMKPSELVELTIKDLLRLKIIDSEDWIAQTEIKLVKYTYPIPTVNLEIEKVRMRHLLEKYKLYLIGRNGDWDYINMDGVIFKVKKFFENYGARLNNA